NIRYARSSCQGGEMADKRVLTDACSNCFKRDIGDSTLFGFRATLPARIHLSGALRLHEPDRASAGPDNGLDRPLDGKMVRLHQPRVDPGLNWSGLTSKSLAAAALLGWLAAWAFEGPAAAQSSTQGIAGNPGAVDVEPGSGALGRLIGFGPDTGVRLGGVLVTNGNYLASGGNDPGTASFNNLLVTALATDLDKL